MYIIYFYFRLLISVSSYGMINEDITIYTIHEILKEELVPNVLERKLALEGNILISFHKRIVTEIAEHIVKDIFVQTHVLK